MSESTGRRGSSRWTSSALVAPVKPLPDAGMVDLPHRTGHARAASLSLNDQQSTPNWSSGMKFHGGTVEIKSETGHLESGQRRKSVIRIAAKSAMSGLAPTVLPHHGASELPSVQLGGIKSRHGLDDIESTASPYDLEAGQQPPLSPFLGASTSSSSSTDRGVASTRGQMAFLHSTRQKGKEKSLLVSPAQHHPSGQQIQPGATGLGGDAELVTPRGQDHRNSNAMANTTPAPNGGRRGSQQHHQQQQIRPSARRGSAVNSISLETPNRITQRTPSRRDLRNFEREGDLDPAAKELARLREQEQIYMLSRLQVTPPSSHWPELFYALYSLVFQLSKLLCDIFLIRLYLKEGFSLSASAIVAFYCAESIVQMIVDYACRGRLRYWLFDILQLRVVVEFIIYFGKWRRMYDQRWVRSHFRPDLGFESFFSALPSMAIQAYVMIVQSFPIHWIQWVAFVTSCLQVLVHIIPFYRYLEFATPIYVILICKAAFNTAVRTILIALLIDRLGILVLAPLGGTYVLGLLIIFYLLYRVDTKDRDDPLIFASCKMVFGGIVSLVLVFTSIPFAPCHCGADWWLGYLISESKIMLENVAVAAVVVGVWGVETSTSAEANRNMSSRSDIELYLLISVVVIFLIFNFFALILVHREMKPHLDALDYTTDTIIDFFAGYCNYIRTQQIIEEYAEDDSETDDEDHNADTNSGKETGHASCCGCFGSSKVVPIHTKMPSMVPTADSAKPHGVAQDAIMGRSALVIVDGAETPRQKAPEIPISHLPSSTPPPSSSPNHKGDTEDTQLKANAQGQPGVPLPSTPSPKNENGSHDLHSTKDGTSQPPTASKSKPPPPPRPLPPSLVLHGTGSMDDPDVILAAVSSVRRSSRDIGAPRQNTPSHTHSSDRPSATGSGGSGTPWRGSHSEHVRRGSTSLNESIRSVSREESDQTGNGLDSTRTRGRKPYNAPVGHIITESYPEEKEGSEDESDDQRFPEPSPQSIRQNQMSGGSDVGSKKRGLLIDMPTLGDWERMASEKEKAKTETPNATKKKHDYVKAVSSDRKRSSTPRSSSGQWRTDSTSQHSLKSKNEDRRRSKEIVVAVVTATPVSINTSAGTTDDSQPISDSSLPPADVMLSSCSSALSLTSFTTPSTVGEPRHVDPSISTPPVVTSELSEPGPSASSMPDLSSPPDNSEQSTTSGLPSALSPSTSDHDLPSSETPRPSMGNVQTSPSSTIQKKSNGNQMHGETTTEENVIGDSGTVTVEPDRPDSSHNGALNSAQREELHHDPR